MDRHIKTTSATGWSILWICTDLGDDFFQTQLHLGEVKIEDGDVGHDGPLIWVWHQDVLCVQQLDYTKLALSQGEGMSQVLLWGLLTQTRVIKQVRPGEKQGDNLAFIKAMLSTPWGFIGSVQSNTG